MPKSECGFPGGSGSKDSTCNAGNPGLIPGWGRSPGGGNSNPLQYSCLENPVDGGAWRATVHGLNDEPKCNHLPINYQSCLLLFFFFPMKVSIALKAVGLCEARRSQTQKQSGLQPISSLWNAYFKDQQLQDRPSRTQEIQKASFLAHTGKHDFQPPPLPTDVSADVIYTQG